MKNFLILFTSTLLLFIAVYLKISEPLVLWGDILLAVSTVGITYLISNEVFTYSPR